MLNLVKGVHIGEQLGPKDICEPHRVGDVSSRVSAQEPESGQRHREIYSDIVCGVQVVSCMLLRKMSERWFQEAHLKTDEPWMYCEGRQDRSASSAAAHNTIEDIPRDSETGEHS